MENEFKTIIGIVVWQQKDLLKYFIWCKESYVGNDGILIANPENPVKIGDWVEIQFTKSDYQKYFPKDCKTVKPPQFEATEYLVIPRIYETHVDGATIRIRMDQVLMENQNMLEHHFFGRIHNNNHKQFPSDQYTITIRRVAPGNRDSVWVLEIIERIQEKSEEIPIIGIIVGHSKGMTFIWCKERPPGQDIMVKTPLPSLEMGTWITFNVPKSLFNKAFPSEMPTNGFLPRFEVVDFEVIHQIHDTFLTGGNSTTINLKLECFIGRNDRVEDICHPFVGLIINEFHKFTVSGKYSITVIRARSLKNEPIKSVWFLRNPQLIEIDRSSLNQSATNLESHLRYKSMNDLTKVSEQQTPKYSRLAHQARNMGSTQSVYALLTAQPIPAPRYSLEERFQSNPAPKKAIINKIMKFENYENIFVWLLDDHKDGILKLKVAAEKFNLKMGSTFTAVFKEIGGKLVSHGLFSNIVEEYDDTRENLKGGIDIKVSGKAITKAGETGNQYPMIFHHHFGEILDNFHQLQNHENLVYHMWIRRSKVGNEHRWVVLEQINKSNHSL